MSTSHEDIKLTKYSSPKKIPSNQGEYRAYYRPTRRQWQNRCSNHVPYQMDDKGALGSITSNCTVLRSTPDDAKDVDRARKVRIRGISSQMNRFRGDEQVDLFWTKVTSKAGAVDVGEPALPRRRKAPFRFDDICCAIEGDFPETTSTKNKFASNCSFGR